MFNLSNLMNVGCSPTYRVRKVVWMLGDFNQLCYNRDKYGLNYNNRKGDSHEQYLR